jgi:hypothetical protein
MSSYMPYWQVVKSNPTFMVLDPLQLLQDLLFPMVCSLNYFPKIDKFVILYRPIMVIVDSVKKLLSADAAESFVPVVDGFLLLDGTGVVLVKQPEDLIYFGDQVLRELGPLDFL